MRPLDPYTNGDDSGGAGAGSEGSDEEAEAEREELSLCDAEAPARALLALNALRKSRQHFDVVLVAGGLEVPAHRAVLAAASPHLLDALPASGPAAPHRLDVDAAALQALVEYAYSGRLEVRCAASARALYAAAWRLRMERARRHLAERLLRRLRPAAALPLRALPALQPDQQSQLDRYIADNFEEIWASGALAALPQVRVEVLREGSAGAGPEAPLTVADAVLAWLRDQPDSDRDFSELCSRPHLVYVDARGALRDCGELPAAPGDAPELELYRRSAAARKRAPAGAAAGAAGSVLGARRAGGGGTRALVALGARLLSVRAGWAVGGGGGGAALARGARAARLSFGRAALGAAPLAGRLLACGGYDRARVLRSAEAYEPALGAWVPAPDMRRERARFALAALGDSIYALGGSDGHTELDSVDMYSAATGWVPRARLPLCVAHAAAAATPGAQGTQGTLYVAGGWAGGGYLRRVWRLERGAAGDAWRDAPPLGTARAQCGGAYWRAALWVLGGCDAWHCLASAERLALPAGAEHAAGWRAAPALPTPRRSMGCSVWRDRLVAAGGSDGAASLARTDWLDAEDGPWVAGPALRRARAGPGLAVLDGTLYAVGGFDGKEFLSCAECLSSPDGEWTALCASSGPPAPLATPVAAPEEPATPVAAPGEPATPVAAPGEPATPDAAPAGAALADDELDSLAEKSTEKRKSVETMTGNEPGVAATQ